MTKGLGLAAAFAVALLAIAILPAASAHGATPSREIDTRVLLDDDGAFGFGGCVKSPTAQCVPGFENTAVDLLNLDVREAVLRGEPAIQFRTVWQAAADHADRSIKLTFTVGSGGKAQAFDYTSADGKVFTSSTFDRLDGPTPVGDGHPMALDGWVLESKLGVKPGDTLEGISLESFTGTTDGDLMPGDWYANGAVMPHVADDPAEAAGAADTPAPGVYKVAGPAKLLDVSVPAGAVADLSHGPVRLAVSMRNPLNSTTQFTNLAVQAPAGVQAALEAIGVNLAPQANRSVTLSITSAPADGLVNVTVTSDLGAYQVVSIPVKAAPVVATASASGPHASGATGTGATATGPGKGAPGVGASLALVALLAGVAAWRRPS